MQHQEDSLTSTKAPDSAQEILRLFLAVKDDEQARLLLERLIQEHADPVIKAVVRRKMGVHLDHVRHLDRMASERTQAGSKRSVELDAEDVHASSVLSLLEHLWALKGSAPADTIRDFRAYVGQIAINAFAMHMRRCFPERHRLRRKLWYLMRNHTSAAGFALWQGQSPGEQICGFRAWEGQPPRITGNYQRWQQNPREFQEKALSGRNPRQLSFPTLVAHILNWVEAPMDIEHMIGGLVELLGLSEVKMADG